MHAIERRCIDLTSQVQHQWIQRGLPGKGVRSHAHALVHASQRWKVRLLIRLLIEKSIVIYHSARN